MTKDLETAAREWWIIRHLTKDKLSIVAVCDTPSIVNDPCYEGIPITHVIEYSAYDKALKRIEELEAKCDFSGQVNLLERELTKEREISKMLEAELHNTKVKLDQTEFTLQNTFNHWQDAMQERTKD